MLQRRPQLTSLNNAFRTRSPAVWERVLTNKMAALHNSFLLQTASSPLPSYYWSNRRYHTCFVNLLLPILSLWQTRNKILGEIIVFDVGHRQTAPPGSQDSSRQLHKLMLTDFTINTDTTYCMYNFYLLKTMIQVNIITYISLLPGRPWQRKIIAILSALKTQLSK